MINARKPNRLIKEKSPYLRQHALNPVNWYPWGEEAFATAKRRDKPVFLSVGYSTCHWCHVMERESFADEEIAHLLNDLFIAVKVDREERPDIDGHYMSVCQILTGGGGWPLTILMTPDKKPFFAGTYLPKESRHGLTGLKDLLNRVGEVWRSQRGTLVDSAERIREAVSKVSLASKGPVLPESIMEKAFVELEASFDRENGGFGGVPKFPIPHHLTFLLRYAHRTSDDKALLMVEKTLRAMRRGGIFDHLGFGFHRYATDADWIVPHFEKMLYDQALLAMAYAEAYQLKSEDEYAWTVDEIITYILRDMTSPEGGFYSAEDADSEGEEGKFYLWTEREIRKILTPEEAGIAVEVFNIRPVGNFHDAGNEGRNILFLKKSQTELAKVLNISQDDLSHRLAAIREKLFEAREKRIHPLKDKKILVDWNGLMIAALAKSAQSLGREKYATAAEKAARFILERLKKGQILYHRYMEGEAAIPGFLDDYAFFIWGLLELYETVFDPFYLESALALIEESGQYFWHKEGGGFFFSRESDDLPDRRKEVYDGAIPSGNSVMMLNLLRLGRLTGEAGLEKKAEDLAKAFSAQIAVKPMAYTQLLNAIDFARGPAFEIVIVGRKGAKDTRNLIRALHSDFIPRKAILFRPNEEESPRILKLASYAESMTATSGKAAAYVCSNFRCQLPTSDPEEMLALLKQPPA